MDIVLLHLELSLNFSDISGTAEFLRTSDFGVVYTQYRLAFHGKQDVLGSLGHFRNG